MCSGFTIVEVLITLVLVTIGMGAFAQSIVASSLTSEENRRTALASQAARRTLEQLKGTNFADVFATFNATDVDDPGGPGTAPGAAFDVPGLTPIAGDPDGAVGRISFPTSAGAPGVLREDVVDARLGMPRDLNGDAAVDGLDHSGDYRLLPVGVTIQWQGASGPARVDFKTFLVSF